MTRRVASHIRSLTAPDSRDWPPRQCDGDPVPLPRPCGRCQICGEGRQPVTDRGRSSEV